MKHNKLYKPPLFRYFFKMGFFINTTKISVSGFKDASIFSLVGVENESFTGS